MKKLLLFFVGGCFCLSVKAQGIITPLQDWTTVGGTQNLFHKNVVKTDASGNSYVAGSTVTSAGDEDIILIKMNQGGTVLWTKQYDGSAHYMDGATDEYIDASGNVYITGYVVNDAVHHYSDCITIKYNSSGVQQWVSTYNGTGSTYDSGAKCFEDGSGNVYVCGGTTNSSLNRDFLALKYNSSGVQQWSREYNGTANMDDAAVKCAVSGGALAVLGVSQATTTTYKPLTLSLNLTTGAVISATYSSSSATSMNLVNDLVKDVSGNLYLVGGTPVTGHGYDFTTIKLTGSTLALAWEVDYNGGSSLDDVANSVQVDASGNVYVTGYTTSSTQKRNMMTIKYNSSGTSQWNVTYNDTLNGNDVANSLVLDASNNVYITGYDSTKINGTDYYTIKYNSSGTQQWSIRADGYELEDKATDIALDTLGNIIVSGESKKTNGTYEYKTIRYVQKSIITPTDYNSETAQLSFNFYENKGQLINTSGSTIPTERFYVYGSPDLYFTNNSMSMVFGHVDTVHSTSDTVHRIDLTFTQVNSGAKTYSLEEQPDFVNYYLAHCPTGINEVHSNKRLITTDLYPNIDLVYYSNQNGFKYYFIIKPGGNPASIKMVYTGASSFNLNGTTNALTINSAVGSITYDRPTVYQLNSSNAIVNITGWTADWQTDGASNKYKFNIGTYNTAQALVIEVDRGNAAACTPANSYKNIRLSSYYGGTYWDMQRAVAAASYGAYYAGNSSSHFFPVTTSATTVTGDQTAVCLSFDYYGNRNWATFFGGTATDDANGVSLSYIGGPIMVGYTYSTDMPRVHSGNQYTQSYGGGGDAFVVRFSGSGSVIYSTYFGGAGYECFNKDKTTMTDSPNEFLYVAGTGTEASPHVNQTGAYNSPTSPSGKKGIIAEFDHNDSLIWSTFIGADIRGLAMYPQLYVGIGGYVKNDSLPYKYVPGSGSYFDSTYNAANDAFLGVITLPYNTIKWLTYSGGSKSDMCNSVAFDYGVEGNPPSLYGIGNSGSSTDMTNDFVTYNPGGWSYYNGTYHGKGDVTMWKYSIKGTRLWVSYYGTGTQADNIDDGNDVVVDYHNNVYFCGESASILEQNGFGTHDWYNQTYASSTSDYQTFLFMLYSNTTQLFWATRFGGNLFELGSGLATDGANYLYMTGTTGTASNATGFPAYRPSGYSPTAWYVCQHQPTVSEGDGYFAQFDISGGVATGVTEHTSNENGLISFPNPFSNEITFNFSVEDSKGYTIEIYNTLGQIVYTEKSQTAIGQVSKTVDLGFINNGIYFVQVKLTNRILASKLIRQ